MKKDLDLDYIAKLERAIREKYGDEAIENPKKHWNEEKEIKHDEERNKFYKRKYFKKLASEKTEYKGFLIEKRVLDKKTERVCPVCESYSMSAADDIYMIKFDCCSDCYIQYVEHREERWESGWRPEIEVKTTEDFEN